MTEDGRGVLEDVLAVGHAGEDMVSGHESLSRQLRSSTYPLTTMSPSAEIQPLAHYTELMNQLLPVCFYCTPFNKYSNHNF